MSALRVIRRFRELKDVTFGSPADGHQVVYHLPSDKLILAPPSGGVGDAAKVDKDGVVAATSRLVANKVVDWMTNESFKITGDGKIQWGDQINSLDTELYRESADRLKTDGTFLAGQLISASGAVHQTMVSSYGSKSAIIFGNADDTRLFRQGPGVLRTDGTLDANALTVNGVPVGSGWTTVTKSADESIANSIALQNDDELFFATVNGGLYEMEAVLCYASPGGAGTVPDMKVAFGEDAAARGNVRAVGLLPTDAHQAGATSAILTNQTSTILFGTALGNRIGRCDGVHTGGGGTFRVMWSQNQADAIATVMRAGSLLRYRRVL